MLQESAHPAASVETPADPGDCDGQVNGHVEAVVAAARGSDRAEARRRVHALTEGALAATGRGLELRQAELSGLDLSGFDLRRAVLNRASLYGTSLAGADLSGASLVCAGLERTDLTEANLTGAYAHALAAQASKFIRANLSGVVDATGALFHGCDLTGARLDGANLAGATFYQCSLVEAHAQGADLRGGMVNECRLESADLTRALVEEAVLLRSSLQSLILERARGRGLVVQRPVAADGLRLSHAHLPDLRLAGVRARDLLGAGLAAPGIDVRDVQLPDADLHSADLSRGRLERVSLDRAKLTGALLTDSTWLGVSAVDLEAANVTGEGLTATECALASAHLEGFSGRYATFRNCDLRAADLRGAYLYRAVIVGDPPSSACLVGARLDGANLTQAYLAADCTRASFRGGWATYARVNQSSFRQADLRGTSWFHASAVKADFTGATLGGQGGALFADRCPGLLEALRSSGDPASRHAAELLEEFGDLLTRDGGKST